MQADKSTAKKPVKSRAEEEPIFLFVPVSDELRRLAKHLEAAFARIYPVQIASKRRAAGVFLKLPHEHSEDARKILAYLGTCLTRVLPPSFEDYYGRHETRQKAITGLQEKEAKIVTKSIGNGLSDQPPGHDDQAERDFLRQKLGDDPLEHPLWILRPNFPTAELMIFLEQYLPSGLEEVAGDVAHTKSKFCQLPFVLLSLLEAFRMGFRGIDVVRADFVFLEHKLYADVDRAHTLLLQLAEIVRETVLNVAPHTVAILEERDDLVFIIDDVRPALTKSQKDTLAALAILEGDLEFTTTKLAKLLEVRADTTRLADQCFINRRKSLHKILPRLEYNPKGGVRKPKGLLFGEKPSPVRLKKFLDGNFGV